ncbi:hypothetical protein A3D77_02130 [Candidatus Gottesmanbacteria bacterium RIFCSPHIGHO2_02_FULL_39_11]|uniref:HEPN domain-containing protein n=1 Tax=Candidatus Gottesmanbacteria bacterium RIFCSPHIGHO2_02_FULL_39_11 TaxID=1798382 RepID=A0A1F5ZUE0_9BACT|nr:MAG: hypothetical protein A3D77_02130 [Candidatus Gottesmanbacteria bacterium RIFCSPHIGHO2_02_FULL_39_11]
MQSKEKEEFINAWVKSGQEDLDVAEDLFKKKRYSYSLFFCHLSLEKILKAVFIAKNDDAPPPLHDLIKLCQKCGIKLNESKVKDLTEISSFNIEARYDVMKEKLYKKATVIFTKGYLSKTTLLFKQFEKLIS